MYQEVAYRKFLERTFVA